MNRSLTLVHHLFPPSWPTAHCLTCDRTKTSLRPVSPLAQSIISEVYLTWQPELAAGRVWIIPFPPSLISPPQQDCRKSRLPQFRFLSALRCWTLYRYGHYRCNRYLPTIVPGTTRYCRHRPPRRLQLVGACCESSRRTRVAATPRTASHIEAAPPSFHRTPKPGLLIVHYLLPFSSARQPCRRQHRSTTWGT